MPLQITPAFWQAFCPMQVTSHVSAVQRTPAVHAEPVRQLTLHSLPLHVTPPDAHELAPSHVMLQRSVELHSMPAVHDEPCLHVTSQNLPPHTSFEFVHAFVPSQVTLHPAACEQSTPVWQAVPPVHRISQVWFGGQTAAQLVVHEITHQPSLLQVPFAAVHSAGSHIGGPPSGGASSTAPSVPASSGRASVRVLNEQPVTSASTRQAARTYRG